MPNCLIMPYGRCGNTLIPIFAWMEPTMLHKRFFKTKDEAEVTFEFFHPDAQEVCLFGDFNDWQPKPMKFNKKQGVFTFKQRLPLDQEFHFRYLINGDLWDNDHQADNYVANDFGTENSVVNTQRVN